MLNSQPSFEQNNQINAHSAKQSQKLAKRLIKIFKKNGSDIIISVSQREINGLTALLHRAFPLVNAEVRISKYGAVSEVAIALPFPGFTQYLNISADVLPSKNG